MTSWSTQANVLKTLIEAKYAILQGYIDSYDAEEITAAQFISYVTAEETGIDSESIRKLVAQPGYILQLLKDAIT